MYYDFSKWIDEDSYVSGFDIIDLSEMICENTEVPGEKGYSDPDTQFKQFKTGTWVDLNIKPYYITKIVMGAHVGTHIDAPMHAVEGGVSVDKIANEYIAPVVIIEANQQLNSDILATKLLKVNKESIVFIRGKSNYKMPNEFRQEIIRKSPRLVIFADCVNVDGVEDTIKYLENNIPMIMGVNQRASNKLDDGDIIFALPIKFKGIEAAPVRLFAAKLKLEKKNTLDNDMSIFTL